MKEVLIRTSCWIKIKVNFMAFAQATVTLNEKTETGNVE